eukprot:m51a1_g3669 hypothetical protein (184) ;mRNA; r:265600-266436
MATRPRVLKGKAKRDMEAWNKHCDDIHHKKLEQMRPQIDTAPPETVFVGAMRDAKTKEIQLARQREVDRENEVLIGKLHVISKGSGGPQMPPAERSLNRRARREELDRINTENMRIVRKMQTIKGKYDHKEWEEENRKHQKLMTMISEFPPIRGAATAVPPQEKRKKSAGSSDEKLPEPLSPS